MTLKEHELTNEIIKQARNLLSNPANWTTFVSAKNTQNQPVDPCCPSAVAFDALGACECLATAPNIYSLCVLRLNYASMGYATDLNDKGDHQAVLAMFDRALNFNPFLVNI